MKEQFITFETAKLAKEKGFDALCNNTYNIKGKLSEEWNISPEDLNEKDFYCTRANIDINYTLAPTQALLQKWLREEKDIHVWVTPESVIKVNESYLYHIKKDSVEHPNEISLHFKGTYGLKYEQALEVGLYEALRLIKV